jgi:hypothetical protein
MGHKYLSGGEIVNVIQEIDAGYVVRELLEEDGEEFEGDPRIVSRVFDLPPKQRFDVEIASKRAELAVCNEQLAEARCALSDAKSALKLQAEEAKKRADFFKTHAKLQRLEDFINGRITHYVVHNYSGYDILTLEATGDTDGEGRSRYGNRGELKLLCLFGRSNGDLLWRISMYSDGSGSATEVTPFTSYQDAKDFVQEKVNNYATGNEYAREGLINVARKHDLKIPAALLREVAEKKLKCEKERVVTRTNELRVAEEQLKQAELEWSTA